MPPHVHVEPQHGGAPDAPLRFGLFSHSLVSDWNNGNAHFLRGLVVALQEAGHEALAFEPWINWSTEHLVSTAGAAAILGFAQRFPTIQPRFYQPPASGEVRDWLDLLEGALDGVDVLIIHEWNPPGLVRAAGLLAGQGGPLILFHDTHYRAVTEDELWETLGLPAYDAVLAFSPALPPVYRDRYGVERAVVFHEAADTHVFQPQPPPSDGPLWDVVFVGNWGDDDRAATMRDYLFEAAAALPRHRFLLHGVRYTPQVLATLARSGIRYGDWIANTATPQLYAATRLAVHIPRQPYLDLLPGTPTIRVFEALACGAALVSLPWDDTDGLFSAGDDYVEARSPAEMRQLIVALCADDARRAAIAAHGLATVRARHTCAHRAAQLVRLVGALR